MRYKLYLMKQIVDGGEFTMAALTPVTIGLEAFRSICAEGDQYANVHSQGTYGQTVDVRELAEVDGFVNVLDGTTIGVK